MKKLFLASSFKDVAPLLAQLEKDLQGKRVTFIPTASVVESVTFYVKSGRKALEKMGLLIDELEISTATPAEIAKKLQRNDFIYITGGNTFFLLQELQKKGADHILREQVDAGKLYIGESAGAMIAAPAIEYAAKMDSLKKAPELSGYEGLGLVDFYPVPHRGYSLFAKAVEKIIDQYGASLPLAPISNQEAIVVCNGEADILTV